MSTETQHGANPHLESSTEAKANPRPVIHRVCVSCNNMFRVTPENVDAKICPNCHKG